MRANRSGIFTIPSACASLAILAMLVIIAGDAAMDRPSLRGLPGVSVLVELPTPDALGQGMTIDKVRTIVELRLRKSGITVLENSTKQNGRPTLHVTLNAVKPEGHPILAYSIGIGFMQDVKLVRDEKIIAPLATTWHVTYTGIAGVSVFPMSAKENLADLTDQFANAFLAMNP